jgi:hypothetical protein
MILGVSRDRTLGALGVNLNVRVFVLVPLSRPLSYANGPKPYDAIAPKLADVNVLGLVVLARPDALGPVEVVVDAACKVLNRGRVLLAERPRVERAQRVVDLLLRDVSAPKGVLYFQDSVSGRRPSRASW